MTERVRTTTFGHGGQTWTLNEGAVSHLTNADGSTQGVGRDRRGAIMGVFGIGLARGIEAQLQLNEEEATQQDVPLLQGDLTSSVGALWPPDRASFKRIKGIYTPGVVRNQENLTEIVNVVNEAQSIFNGEVSRVSLRAVVDINFLEQIRKDETAKPLVEAIIPLSGTQPAFENAALVYFGLNHSTRQPIQKEMERYLVNLEAAFSHRTLTPQEIRDRVVRNGYEIRVLAKEDITEESIDQVAQLYERFGWTREEVSMILNNPNNIIGVAIKDSAIVSAGIAEMARIPIGSDSLRIAEVTEAATHEDHAKNGLYTAVSSGLLEELFQRSQQGEILGGELDLAYGECNGNALGVLKTAHIQGREFAFHAGFSLGFSNSGVLRQHVPIAGLPIETEYNDLFPAFITRAKLNEIYSQ